MEEKQINGRKVWESAKPFVFGGLAGMMATSIIQPLDFFKVRIYACYCKYAWLVFRWHPSDHRNIILRSTLDL